MHQHQARPRERSLFINAYSRKQLLISSKFKQLRASVRQYGKINWRLTFDVTKHRRVHTYITTAIYIHRKMRKVSANYLCDESLLKMGISRVRLAIFNLLSKLTSAWLIDAGADSIRAMSAVNISTMKLDFVTNIVSIFTFMSAKKKFRNGFEMTCNKKLSREKNCWKNCKQRVMREYLLCKSEKILLSSRSKILII